MPVYGFGDINSGGRNADRLPGPGPQATHVPKFMEVMFPGYSFKAITTYLTIAQIIVYIITCCFGVGENVSPSITTLLNFGANFSSLVKKGEVWRLICPIFLHASIFHIAMNMFVQMQIGFRAESHFGTKTFAIFYFLAGIAGCITSAAFKHDVVSVGASGAIFGVLGMRLAVSFIENGQSDVHRQKFIYELISLVFMGLILSLQQGVDHLAHLGGFVAGLCLALISPKSDYSLPAWHGTARILAVVGLIAVYLTGTLMLILK